jgi:outer membrane protein OmpA-like peptidoglycan-associated protein
LAKIVVAEPLHFEEGGAGLKPSSDAVLGKIVTAAQACKDSVIHIFGHTDNAGDTAANKVLSTERAKAVGVALMKKGIAHKVRATGLGGKFPIADNETEAGRAQNNRIEFKVYKIEESKS